jgi:hypothetical protein
MTSENEPDSDLEPSEHVKRMFTKAAKSAMVLYQAYHAAGFSHDQSFELTLTALEDTMDNG